MSTAYHSQTDGQTEKVNRVLEDLLRICILDFRGTWEEHLPLVKLAYSDSFQTSIGMAPFEALYGRPCESPSCWIKSTGGGRGRGRTGSFYTASIEDATWEAEEMMRLSYPHLFDGSSSALSLFITISFE